MLEGENELLDAQGRSGQLDLHGLCGEVDRSLRPPGLRVREDDGGLGRSPVGAQHGERGGDADVAAVPPGAGRRGRLMVRKHLLLVR